MISQFGCVRHTLGESVSIRRDVVWRCEHIRHLISFLLCVVSVVLSLSVLSLSFLCCCYLSYFCLHVTWFSKQAPTHLLFWLTNKLARSNNGSLDASNYRYTTENKGIVVYIAAFPLWRMCVYLQRVLDAIGSMSPSSPRTCRCHLLYALQEKAASREPDQNTHQTAAAMGILP